MYSQGEDTVVSLTQAAADRVRTMAPQGDPGLRLMIKGGGCSGLSYDMDLEDEEREGDSVTVSHGVRLYVDPMSQVYLSGVEIDYIETFAFSGFHFNNPNAERSCGCGSSFSVA